MKKGITICFLLATVFTVKAQQMNFEETVKYINDKIDCCSYYKGYRIIANKNGDVVYKKSDSTTLLTFNFFDNENYKLKNNYCDDFKTGDCRLIDQQFGIAFRETFQKLHITIISIPSLVFIPGIDNEINGERIMKALLHLRSLCTKAKDPFDK